ncbi:hypothetical protein P7C71_g3133, partial [Lecanoromycetidae sp. Uapishka_2]
MAFPGPTRSPITSTVPSLPDTLQHSLPPVEPPPSLLPSANKAGPYIYDGHAVNLIVYNSDANQWQRFLFAARARHLSYHKEFAQSDHSADRLEYKRLYDNTMLAIDHALSHQHRTSIEEQNRLIEMERNLTHETFTRFPVLWDMCFDANSELLEEICRRFDLLYRVPDPKSFLMQHWRRMEREWIVLDDAVDVLSGDDPT